MALSVRGKRRLKYVSLVSVIVVLVLFAILQVIGNRMEPFVSNLLKENVEKSTDGLYKLEFSNLSITLADQHIRISDMHIIPQPAVYERMKQAGTAPSMLYEITIPRFTIGWLNLFKAYFGGKLQMRSIEISEPQVLIQQFDKRPSVLSKFQLDPYRIISSVFSSASVSRISIINGNMLFQQKLLKSSSFSVTNLNLQINGVVIDSSSKSDTTEFLKTESVKLSFKNLNYQTPDTLYNISIDECSYSTKSPLTVKIIQLQPNREIYDKLKALKKAPGFLYTIVLPAVSLDSLNLYKLFFQSAIQISKMQVTKPQISIAQSRRKEIQKDSVVVKGDLYEIINSIFSSVSSREIKVANASIEFLNKNETGSFLRLKNCDLVAYDVAIDSISQIDPERFLASKNIELSMRQLSYLTPDSLYRLKVGRLAVSLKNGSAKIDSFQLIPRYTAQDFMKHTKYKTTRAQLIIPVVTVEGIDFRNLFYNEQLYVKEVNADRMTLDAYCDKQLPESGKVIQTPQQLLASLSLPLTIETFRLRNFNVVYKEVPPSGGEPGMAAFSNCSITFSNVTNDPARLATNSACTAEITGLLFGKGEMKARLIFYLNDKRGRFTLSGTVGPMPASAFNTFFEPAAGGKVESGEITSATITIVADNIKAAGMVNVLYHNLKADFKKDEAAKGSEKLKEKAANFIVNSVVINDNPTSDKKERVGEIEYARDDTRFILNYIWKSIFSGLKAVVLPKSSDLKENFKEMKKTLGEMKKKDKGNNDNKTKED